jgi:hypothetical protein
VSHKPTANAYAPTSFAKEEEAKSAKLRKSDFDEAMRRLFADGRIRVEEYGRPSRPNERIALRGATA